MILYYMLAALPALIGGTGSLMQKLWQKRTITLQHAGSVYILMMSIFASMIFSVMNGFSFSINRYTLACSAGYAAVVILGSWLILAAMSHMNLLLCSVFQRGSTLLIWLWGVLVMHDSMQVAQGLAAVLMLASILAPLYGNRSHVGVSKKAALSGAAIMINGAAGSVLLKYYTQNQQKMPNSCLCLYTNLLILVYVLIQFVFSKNRKEQMLALKKTGKY